VLGKYCKSKRINGKEKSGKIRRKKNRKALVTIDMTRFIALTSRFLIWKSANKNLDYKIEKP